MTDLMKGKRGLVMGVANDRSIAWGIAKALHAEGRSWPSPTRGRPSANGLSRWRPRVGSTLSGRCGRDGRRLDGCLFRQLGEAWGSLDFVVHAIAFSDKTS
jgi:enoyl-[acyl-carrier protein] reductase I